MLALTLQSLFTSSAMPVDIGEMARSAVRPGMKVKWREEWGRRLCRDAEVQSSTSASFM